MGTAVFCFCAVKMDLRPLSHCGAIFYPPKSHSGPEISLLLHTHIYP